MSNSKPIRLSSGEAQYTHHRYGANNKHRSIRKGNAKMPFKRSSAEMEYAAADGSYDGDGSSHRDHRSEEFVITVLGLGPSFLKEWKLLPDDIMQHRNIEDWVQILLEKKYDEIKDDFHERNLDKELLVKIGFRGPSKVLQTILSRSKLYLPRHEDPIDAVKRFVVDEFKYNPALNRYKSCVAEEEIKENLSVDTISVDVIVNSKGAISDTTSAEQIIPQSTQDCEVLYHGTDIESAADILSGGIAVSMGSQKRDFSDGTGFYLTHDFEDAKTFAFKITQKPVVLIFKIPKSCLKNAKILSLSKESKTSQWKEIVTANRSGRLDWKMRKMLNEYDCIEGPISVVCEADSKGETGGSTVARKAMLGSYQLCVINDEFADEISKCLKTIIICKLSATMVY